MNQLASDVYTFSQDLSVAGAQIGTKMTVVSLSNGEVWVHSPVKINANIKEELKKLGEVKYVIAPNIFHHLYLPQFSKEFPEANVYGSFHLIQKRKDISFYDNLNLGLKPWEGEIQSFYLKGSRYYETLFFHKASKSLIVCDLIFHLNEPEGLLSHLWLPLLGTYKKMAISRLYKSLIFDKREWRKSLEPILDLEVERVILPHGQDLTKNQWQRFPSLIEKI